MLTIMDEKETQIITYDDFAKLQLKTGKVLECVKAENAEKLYILQVDLGEEKPRQIVSSLVDYYSAEALVGKEIVVLANLKPAKMRGHLSQGIMCRNGRFICLCSFKTGNIGTVWYRNNLKNTQRIIRQQYIK